LIRRARHASRRRFLNEEKIRILLEGVRAEMSVAELCHEAGKKRLRGDTQREANHEEVEQLR
jgi:transposase